MQMGLGAAKTIDHKQFYNMLKKAPLSQETTNRVIKNTTLLSNLIHYLAREEKRKVSVDKLKLALQIRPTDKPLL